jgi:polyphenol oxidase
MFMRAPQPNRAFEWTQAPWGAILRCLPLSAVADHFFTAKNLTLRDNADEWEAVAAAMHVAREDLLLVRQVHEATVAVASPDRARPWPRPDADAIVSNDASAAIGVRVADCVPILLAEETGRVVAAVHAGWRGTSKRAVIAAVSAMQSRFGVRPERLIAAIGPSIGPCCYEVAESTRATFRDEGHHPSTLDQWFEPRAEGKFHLDLWQANCDQLEGTGVQSSAIYVAELCTKTHADVFHSYRVEGTSAGRMLAVIRAKG